MVNWTLSKFKTSALSKTTVKKQNTTHKLGKNLTKEWYPNYTKESYNSILRKKATNELMSTRFGQTLHKRRYTTEQYAHEVSFKIIHINEMQI